MSLFATEYPDGVLKDLDTLFKAGTGPGTTYFSQDGQDLAQRYAPFTTNKIGFNTGFIARDTGQDIAERFEARPPQADMDWSYSINTGNTANLPPHEIGDLIVILAARSGSTTPPSLATGYTSITTSTNSSYARSARVAYKFASSNAETGGPWANATSCMAVVVKRAASYVKFTSGGSSWPALTPSNPGQSVGLHLAMSGSSTIFQHPDDTVLLNGGGGTDTQYAGYTGLVSPIPTATAASGYYTFTYTLEILPAIPKVPLMESDSLITLPSGGEIPLPPHEAGDLLIICGGTAGDTAGTVPAGWTQVLRTTGILYANMVVGSKIAASNADTSGIWVGCNSLAAVVVKGCDGIGAKATARNENTGSGNRITYPALTLQKPAQSGILCFACTNDQSASGPQALPSPTGTQQMTWSGDFSESIASFGGTSLINSWAQQVVSGGNNVNVAASIELFVTGAPAPVEGTVEFGTQTSGHGFNNNQWSGGNCGSWTGNPSNLTGLMAWTDGTDETWLSFNGKYGNFNTITLSLNGEAPVTFTWYAASNVYYAPGDPFGIISKPAGVPYSLVSTGVSLAADAPIALSGDITPPTPPSDLNVTSSTPVNCSPYSAPTRTEPSVNPVNLQLPIIEP